MLARVLEAASAGATGISSEAQLRLARLHMMGARALVDEETRRFVWDCWNALAADDTT